MGYFIPATVAVSYVPNLKNEESTYKYDTQRQDIGIQRQAAIQNLDKSYSDVVNSAYTNYLNSKRGILGSQMGEGYKQAYINMQQQQLQQTVNEASMNAAEARQQIYTNEQKSLEEVQKTYQTEVNNLDRVAASLAQYREYVNTLQKDGQSYLTEEQKARNIEDMYYDLMNAQPEDYDGKTFLKWQKEQFGTKVSEADQTWWNWLTQADITGKSGYDLFKGAVSTEATSKSKDTYTNFVEKIDKYSRHNGITSRVNIYADILQDYILKYNIAQSDLDNYFRVKLEEAKIPANGIAKYDFTKYYNYLVETVGKDKAAELIHRDLTSLVRI